MSSPLAPPLLETARLWLRPFAESDLERIVELAGVREVAAGTLSIPHPYSREQAAAWLATHGEQRAAGKLFSYAITLRESGELIGACGLSVQREHQRAELGYWLGKPYWGRGYTTEAARAVVAGGFRELDLQKLVATHFTWNAASGAVLRKLGFRPEGLLRSHLVKEGVRQDVVVHGVLRNEFRAVE